MTLHANWLEWTFALLSLCTAIVQSISLVNGVYNTLSTLAAHREDTDLVYQAYGNLAQEILRILLAVDMLAVGWEFLFLPPPPPEYRDLPQSLVGLVGWIIAAMIVLTKSAADVTVGRKLRHRHVTATTNGHPE